ncbi:hypothetical protein PHO31112_03534 [Pandoraea horticolens]|uniref:Uncharacterized protein n=1 Tax=Pandoraea horticolens TaxID=2508298 RepID=A0A5E4WVR0_9BURK|nr:hypothetical protein PHO31112_03534 [Pandoraea horticolens]
MLTRLGSCLDEPERQVKFGERGANFVGARLRGERDV